MTLFKSAGELSHERMNDEKEYAINLSAFFYADPDTLNGYIPLEMKAQYYETKKNRFSFTGLYALYNEQGFSDFDGSHLKHAIG